MAQQAKAWVVALNIVYGTIAFGLIGFALDYFLGWSPWGLLTGALIGLLVGTYRFIREALLINAPNPPVTRGTTPQESGPSDGKKSPPGRSPTA